LSQVFNNGFRGFEMAYYLKPMTFNSRVVGYLTRQASLPYRLASLFGVQDRTIGDADRSLQALFCMD
jgi:hypothetical protein